LINAGKILENDKNLAKLKVAIGELLGGVITMHVIVCDLSHHIKPRALLLSTLPFL
jgi:hypothetical protein